MQYFAPVARLVALVPRAIGWWTLVDPGPGYSTLSSAGSLQRAPAVAGAGADAGGQLGRRVAFVGEGPRSLECWLRPRSPFVSKKKQKMEEEKKNKKKTTKSWQHVAAFGSMWQHVAACGSIWQHLAASDSI